MLGVDSLPGHTPAPLTRPMYYAVAYHGPSNSATNPTPFVRGVWWHAVRVCVYVCEEAAAFHMLFLVTCVECGMRGG